MFEYRPITSRAVGMGGAMLPVTNDASAVFFNPAGLSNGPRAEVSLFFHNIFGTANISEMFAGAKGAYKKIGIGFNYLSTGITNVYMENQMLTGVGGEIFKNLNIGATFKILTIVYGTEHNKKTIFNTDVGMIYAIGNTNLALKIRNAQTPADKGRLIPATTDAQMANDQIRAIEAGIARTFFKNTTISIALHDISDPENSFHAGLEYGIYGLYFRMGLMPHIFTGGLGFDRKIVALDISFENVENIGLFYYATLRMKIE